ncbi:uncharacterized protein LOC144548016 [Carex rostrata]
MLNGSNFKLWQENLMLVLGIMDLDLAFRVVAPTINDKSTSDEKKDKEKWERSNRMCLVIMKMCMPEEFRGAFSDKIETAKEFLEDIEKKFVRNEEEFLKEIEKRFVKNEKSEISALLANLVSMKYEGNRNIREYIMDMYNVVSKLRALKLEISEDLLVNLALISLPTYFGHFKASNNCQTETWSLNELISHCVQEEERLKPDRTISAHVSSTYKNNTTKKHERSNTPKDNKEAAESTQKKLKDGKKTADAECIDCFFCGAVGHMKKHCLNYHAWRLKKGLPKISKIR